LRAFLEVHGVHAALLEPGVPTPTVQDAANALGVTPAEIIKSVLFENKSGETVLVVAPGDRRIDAAKLEALTGIAKPRIASAARVLEVTGYAAGGVPPVGHPSGLRVVVDASLLERTVLIGGGGSDALLLKIAPLEIVRLTEASTGDVCV
jgi:prolyl-tRNA editing enzyme YbaK/EbsC (Cys-tRNA(Pro) deacylase)